jgi:hypothetical protein
MSTKNFEEVIKKNCDILITSDDLPPSIKNDPITPPGPVKDPWPLCNVCEKILSRRKQGAMV